MSFTIVTDVFCDGEDCCQWLDEGGVSSFKPQRSKAWKRALSFGWKKIDGKHLCPKCAKEGKSG